MSSPVTRREVLIGGGAALVVAGCSAPSKMDAGGPPVIDPQPYDNATLVNFCAWEVAWTETLFPQAAAAGAMTSSSFLAWTRATGVPQVTFAMEACVDLLAARVGLDPWEMRWRNALAVGDRVTEFLAADSVG